MNFLIVGSAILAGQDGDFVEDSIALYSDGVVFPKNAMFGYEVVVGNLPAGASIGQCEYVGGQIVVIPPPSPPQSANGPIITESFNASLKRKAAKLQKEGKTFEAVQLLLQAQGD